MPPPPSDSSRNGRATYLLFAGAAVGLGLAVAEIVAPSGDHTALPSGAVARVNDQSLSRADFERTLAGLEKESRHGVDDERRRRVLDRLIEEELLIQHGEELGLVRREPRLRGELVASVIDVITAEASAREPSEPEIEAFYRSRGDQLASPGRIRVRQILVRIPPDADDGEVRERAAGLARRLRDGETYGDLSALGDEAVTPVPDSLIPPAKLREYLGPTAAKTALELEPGEVSEPIRTAAGYVVLEVVEREPRTTPPLQEIRQEVVAEWRRDAADRALRARLDELRARARVVAVDPNR